MKYLTKEWFLQFELSYANQFVKKSKRAEKKDEHFYNSLYKKNLKRFIDLEKADSAYLDPDEETRRIEKYANEKNIDDKERERRKYFRDYIIVENEEFKKAGAPFKFDEKAIKERFDKYMMPQRIELFQHLPQYILDKIADIGVFAFGYASAEVKQLLRPYCAELKRKCHALEKQAERETDKAKKYLSEKLRISGYRELLLSDISIQNGDIYLTFDDGDKLLIKGGKIIEKEETKIYPLNTYVPNSGYTIIQAAELYRIGEKFEIHFLIENRDEMDKGKVWYLTIQGTDIREIVTTQNLMFREDLKKIQEKEKQK